VSTENTRNPDHAAEIRFSQVMVRLIVLEKSVILHFTFGLWKFQYWVALKETGFTHIHILRRNGSI